MQTLDHVAGRPIEITVRGPRSFTFSFDAIDPPATEAICGFFADSPAVLSVVEDAECGTFIYCDA